MKPRWRRLGRLIAALWLMGLAVTPRTSVSARPARPAVPAVAASAPAPQASGASAHRAAHEPARSASAALPFKRGHKEEVADRPNRGGR